MTDHKGKDSETNEMIFYDILYRFSVILNCMRRNLTSLSASLSLCLSVSLYLKQTTHKVKVHVFVLVQE